MTRTFKIDNSIPQSSSPGRTLKLTIGFFLGILTFLLFLVIFSQFAESETIIVDDDGGGNFTTIQAAIENATDGDTIEVREGTYSGNITIDKQLNIIGGEAEETIISITSNNTPITITAENVTLSQFIITGKNQTNTAILINANRTEIEDCIITNFSIGVQISSSLKLTTIRYTTIKDIGVDGIQGDQWINYTDIRFNHISYCGGDGIFLTDDRDSLIHNNTSERNGRSGIQLVRSDNPLITKNILSFNNISGIGIASHFTSRLDDNQCYVNRFAGIDVVRNAVITNNRCSFNEYFGIRGEDFNTVTSNNCVSNGRSGFEFEHSNTISQNNGDHNKGSGLIAGAANEVSDNHFSDNQDNGIFMQPAIDSIITNNECYNNDESGIFIPDCINSTITGNDCYLNGKSGFRCLDISDSWVEKNTFSENREYGLRLDDANSTTIFDNSINRNNESGFYLKEPEECEITGNFIQNNSGSGIYLNNPRFCFLISNDCFDNSLYGINMVGGDFNTLERNQCKDNGMSGLKSSDNSLITRNTCDQNGLSGISAGFNCTIQRNFCDRNDDSGIYVEEDECLIENNQCNSNDYHGIFVFNSEGHTLTENDCDSNDQAGVKLFHVDDSIVRNSSCDNNRRSGIEVEGKDNILTGNDCSGNIGSGIQSIACASISDNNCDNNQGDGINSDGDLEIISNICSGNGKTGLVIKGPNSHVAQNLIDYNTLAGIEIIDTEGLECEQNYIFANGRGIEVKGCQTDFVLRGNQILDNEHYGIDAHYCEDDEIDARYNYWGDDSGPYHYEKNPGGEGDTVTDNVLFDPWYKELMEIGDLIFTVSSGYGDHEVIDDSTDGIENGMVDIFQGDSIILRADFEGLGGNTLPCFWVVESQETNFMTGHGGQTLEGEVGSTFFYMGYDHEDPIVPEPNRSPMEYEVALECMIEESIVRITESIMIHPYASTDFQSLVKMGASLLDVTVTLVWRGLKDEAAPAQAYISPERPVFVYVDPDAESPIPDLFTGGGGIGLCYEIQAVGCYFQDGTEGFIEAEIRLPILTSDLQYLGDSYTLQDDLRLERYDEEQRIFLPVDGSDVMADGGVKYVVGTVDNFSLYAAIVDSIYNQSNPGHEEVIPDLEVESIRFSHSPVLISQEFEIKTEIQNDGRTNAYNVFVEFYFQSQLIGSEHGIDLQARGEEHVARMTFQAPDPGNQQSYRGVVTVIVGMVGGSQEPPPQLANNQLEQDIQVIWSDPKPLTPEIGFPTSGREVSEKITISGDSASSEGIKLSTTASTGPPFSYNHVVDTIEPGPIPVSALSYYIVSDEGQRIPELSGDLGDIYGEPLWDTQDLVRFTDFNQDGLLSKGDIFHIEREYPGGFVNGFYTVHVEPKTPQHVEISIDGGPWLNANRNDSWFFQLDTTELEDGEHTVRCRSFGNGQYSDTAEVTFVVDNTVGDIDSALTVLEVLLFLVVAGMLALLFLAVLRTDGSNDEKP